MIFFFWGGVLALLHWDFCPWHICHCQSSCS